MAIYSIDCSWLIDSSNRYLSYWVASVLKERWFDSHCHFDLPAFDGVRAERWLTAQAHGVAGALIPGLEPGQWLRAQACAAGLGEGSFWSVGLHPWWIEKQPAMFTPSMLIDALAAHYANAGCVAIGECGLDGAIALPLAKQVPWLESQLAFAREKSLPVILHQYKAHNELVAVLNRHRGIVGVVHGFNGSLAMAEEYIRRGLLLGVGGVVTYLRANKTRATVQALPSDSFLLETDAPSMPVHGRQGADNRPEYLLEIAQVVAQLRAETLAQLAAKVRANGQRLFRF
ncbi:TatD family hydrolase [Simiduia curdlanivorans]|uniref:TatD family hydrolase n=1 Tax=Simiduia curdlanivorans TaxID=1492769 RepID=A0ABV8V4I1_9GAMM|nr:TatD family hydrolase [Simiduia curdlanivorans]MDN3638331.1 TatD family hydrolase [Simiduia curdlanivorans]